VEPSEYTAEHVHVALAERLSELGVQVTISGDKVFLSGDVATGDRRDAVGEVASQMLPDHEVHNHVSVVDRSAFGGEEVVT
jgi:hypothetical protein